MNVVAVRHRIGLIEFGDEALVERDAGDLLAGKRAPHFHGWRPVGVGQYRILEPELFQGTENVGSKLDAGADLVKLGRLLQHPYRKAFAREGVGCRQTADAAARDQDRRLPIRLRHFSLRPVNPASPVYI